MEKGYGFGAEGDWKTAGMVRLMKIMTQVSRMQKEAHFGGLYLQTLLRVRKVSSRGPICLRCALP